jgi:hypothetical protein
LPVPYARLHPKHDHYVGATQHVRLAARNGTADGDGLHSSVTHSFK